METSRHSDTILVVDDDPEWRAFVADALASYDGGVSAATGRDGVRIARTTRPAAIVLDVLMAGAEDGFTILCELRKDPATQDIPVVLFSNVNAKTHLAFNTADIRMQLGASPDAFVEKPATAETIRRIVTEVIARRRSGHAAPDEVSDVK
jgi:CheY-like chemotaxis protein